MSGDVFGNGMLLSQHIKLVAAFDHRHVVHRPRPRPGGELGGAEAAVRAAPVELGRLRREPDLRRRRHLPADAEVDPDHPADACRAGHRRRRWQALSPAELITACLTAPVDLLWNGGIGTYVKATVGEPRPGRATRPTTGSGSTASELRARCVGEGGNLGLTQLGRIEYANCGGRINTDFIDNSAGVDTSDYEVNIKILLAGEVAAGRLSATDRDELLASMTDEVGRAGARAQLRPEPGAGQRGLPGRLDGRRARGLDGAAVGPRAARPRDRVPADHRGDGGAAHATSRGSDRSRSWPS